MGRWWFAACLAPAPLSPACGEPARPVAALGQPIVGGEPTAEWPAVVAYLIGGEEPYAMCTGTLIGPATVLTAAHCGGIGAVGDTVLIGADFWEYDQMIEVVDIAVHPDYDASTMYHDMAVLQLATEAGIEPIEVNTEWMGSSWTGELLHVVGYGNQDVYTGSSMGTKLETDVEIVDVGAQMLWHQTEGHNTCSGDSGGPALFDDGGGWKVMGVISYVFASEHGADPCSGGGGDVRVDANMDWLSQFVDVELPTDDDDDDDDSDDDSDDGSSYGVLEDHQNGGCATSLAGPGRGGAGEAAALGALLAALAVRAGRRRRRRR